MADSNIPFVATAPIDYDLTELKSDFQFRDHFSDYLMQAFVCNGSLSADVQEVLLRRPSAIILCSHPGLLGSKAQAIPSIMMKRPKAEINFR